MFYQVVVAFHVGRRVVVGFGCRNLSPNATCIDGFCNFDENSHSKRVT